MNRREAASAQNIRLKKKADMSSAGRGGRRKGVAPGWHQFSTARPSISPAELRAHSARGAPSPVQYDVSSALASKRGKRMMPPSHGFAARPHHHLIIASQGISRYNMPSITFAALRPLCITGETSTKNTASRYANKHEGIVCARPASSCRYQACQARAKAKSARTAASMRQQHQ